MCPNIKTYFTNPRLVLELCISPPVILFLRAVLFPLLQPASPELPSYSHACLQVRQTVTRPDAPSTVTLLFALVSTGRLPQDADANLHRWTT